MNEEIKKIIFDLEGCCGMVDYMLTPIENNLLVSYIKQLQQENQQLKQKYEMQKDSNKLLCKAITCDDCDCKVCEAHIENIKYKSVLDEIREQLKLERKLALSLNKPYTLSVIDKLLDKVKE